MYAGPPLGDGDVLLTAPDLHALAAVETGEADEGGPWARWRQRAASTDGTIVYFAVEARGRPVGEVFIHDIDASSRSGLVGYRIFDVVDRRSGIATEALGLLVAWIEAQGSLDRLIGIARTDNTASCRLLQRAGFLRLGPAREDARRTVHELILDRARLDEAGTGVVGD